MEQTYSHKVVNTVVMGGIALFGVLELMAVRLFFAEHYSRHLLLIPVYYMVLGAAVLLLVSRIESRRLHPGRAVARIMLLNVSQLLLSIGLLMAYVYFTGEDHSTFLLVFGLFYIWFMCLKVFVFYNIEHQHKHAKRHGRKHGKHT